MVNLDHEGIFVENRGIIHSEGLPRGVSSWMVRLPRFIQVVTCDIATAVEIIEIATFIKTVREMTRWTGGDHNSDYWNSSKV